VFFLKELTFIFFVTKGIGELGQLKLMKLISKIENSLSQLLWISQFSFEIVANCNDNDIYWRIFFNFETF